MLGAVCVCMSLFGNCTFFLLLAKSINFAFNMRRNVWLCMYVVRCKSWTIWSQLIAFYKHHLFGRCFASENHSLKMNFEKKMRCTQNRIRTRFKHDSFVDKRGKNLIAKCLVCGVYDCHLYVRESTIFTYRTH